MNETNELILKLSHGWGREKAEKLKLLHAIGDKDRKTRIERIASLSASRSIGDSLMDNHVMLPPSSEDVCSSGDIILGDVCFGRNPDGTDRVLYPLKQETKDALSHTLISGSTGTGKTTLAYNIILQIARRGVPVLVFDWHRTYRDLCSLDETAHPFVKDIRVFTIGRDIHPYKGNLFFGGPKHLSMKHWLGAITGAPLQKSLLSGLGSSGLLETEAERLIDLYEEGKLRMVPNIEDLKKGIDKQFLSGRADLWKDSAKRVLSSLLRQNVAEVFSSREPVDFIAEVIDRPGITIFEMDMEFPNHLRILLQEQLVLQLMLTLLHRGETEDLQVALFLEEFHHLLPQSQVEKQVGSDLIEMLFREIRKFGGAVYALTQNASDARAIMSNCKTHIHFSTITYDDVTSVSNALFLKPHEFRFIDYLQKYQALSCIKLKTKNCLLQTRPPPTIRRVDDEELQELSKRW